MNVVFSTSENIKSSFTMTIALIAILITLVVAGFHLSYRNNPAVMKLKTRCLIGVLVWIGVAVGSYISNYGKFISADVTETEVTLHFSGSIYKDITLPRASIGAVSFGMPDRGVSACNISFTENTTGKHYQSAFTRNKQDTCKTLRLEIMKTLQLAS